MILLLLLLLLRVLLRLVLLLLLLLWLLLLLLLLRAGEVNCMLIRRSWPDRACDGDRDVPHVNFCDQLGFPSRWWRW